MIILPTCLLFYMKNYSDKAGIQTARINVMYFCKNNRSNSKYTSLFLNLRGTLHLMSKYEVYNTSD